MEYFCEKLGLLRNPDTTLLLLLLAQPVVGWVWQVQYVPPGNTYPDITLSGTILNITHSYFYQQEQIFGMK